jgi:hypothetical protein
MFLAKEDVFLHSLELIIRIEEIPGPGANQDENGDIKQFDGLFDDPGRGSGASLLQVVAQFNTVGATRLGGKGRLK